MHCKKVCLVVDLREGQNLAQITNMIAVLSAAGWKVDIALKVYGGETMKLATKAVKQGYDLVIAYGGDGTLNQVINGVMHVNGKSFVGVIPGGTANEWAGEISIPGDHVKAALTLVNSDARDVDLGHVEVKSLVFPGTTQSSASSINDAPHKKTQQKKKGSTSVTEDYFLLMAGLGIDAAIIANTSRPLKYHVGRVAFDLAAVKELPKQKPFAIEIQSTGIDGNTEHWQGEVLQVIVANTRRYANMVQITPDAYLDDGLLDVCVIMGGSPITTMEQITSLLLRRKPDPTNSKYLRGAKISMRVPASIHMQLDGNAVDLKDYIGKSDFASLSKAEDIHQVLVDYHFTAEPHALRMAVPRTYDNTLFLHADHSVQAEQQGEPVTTQGNGNSVNISQEGADEHVRSLVEQGYTVTVVGVVPNPDKQQTYIIAGNMCKQSTDETLPVAVLVDNDVIIVKRTGEQVPTASIEKLQEGTDIVVKGNRNKRGVIRATLVVV